ncbi:PaaI family thioesterase [Sphingobium sufflavum]|uniref:PaaI family thioesterase n=1 Tax=Sphingobium sufflavum TaxID=1129547 RepID=UPI001F227559|nr:PaaI family thioesterase [Sphingobium sufflavum]MCE7798555.1 PaaI family thioesterase [Sphingobium sufflavum]
MTHSPATLVADGWQNYPAPHGFSATVAPFWFRVVDDVLSLGLLVEKRHCNEHLGTTHGGALMTFADVAGGFAVSRALGHSRCATIQLQTHFTAASREGDFIQCEPQIVRQTRDVLFVRGLIHAGERVAVGFDGIWKVLAER